MSHASGSTQAATIDKAPWSDLVRDGRAVYSALVLLGVILHALQVLVIAIVMPTVVADIGGADYYTWPAMLYTIGAICGAASVGPVWTAFGQRRGYALSGAAFLLATGACALSPTMGALVVSRALQGFAGGLVTGGGMALVSTLFTEAQRKRILAAHQGTWMIAQLLGPVVGGIFAEIGWWRGSFWAMIPFVVAFIVVAWAKIPSDGAPGTDGPAARARFPFLRIGLLASGTFAIALAGPVDDNAARVGLVLAAVALVWLTLRLDRHAANRLYPSGAFSIFSPVGLGLLVLFCGGMAQTSVNLFLPLLLQVVHGVTPLFISFVTIVISAGWTVGTFVVSGFSGRQENWALMGGLILMFAGMAGMAGFAEHPALIILTAMAFVLGLGVGSHNVLIVARNMANAKPGEERVTSAAMPSIRSLGTAFGAAMAGVVSTVSGLGPGTEPVAVGHAVSMVYTFNMLPLVVAIFCMARLLTLRARRA